MKFLLVVGFALSTVTPVLAGQQQPPADTTCARVMGLVMSGRAMTDTHAGWALATVVRCPNGPVAIAARWGAADDAPATLDQLRVWTRQVRDQRISEAILAMATAPGGVTDVRLTALQSLVEYIDPSITVRWEELKQPPSTAATLTNISDVSPRMGAEPPQSNLPTLIYNVIRGLAGDADPAVARAAHYVWQSLTDGRPQLVTLPANTVTVKRSCPNRYEITNHADVDLSLVVSSMPSLQPRVPAHESRTFIVNTRGAVHVSLYGGPEVAASAPDEAACP